MSIEDPPSMLDRRLVLLSQLDCLEIHRSLVSTKGRWLWHSQLASVRVMQNLKDVYLIAICLSLHAVKTAQSSGY